MEAKLGAPVGFSVRTLNVSVRFRRAAGDLTDSTCCETSAVLTRSGAGRAVAEMRIDATEARYDRWRDSVPEGLLR